MTVIAWVSRHPPVPAQTTELMRRFGEEFHFVLINRTFRDAREVMEELKRAGAEIAIVVLPLSVIERLLPMAKKEGIELWMARMSLVHQCGGPKVCPEFDPKTDVWLPLRGSDLGRHMRFYRFERIKRVAVETEPV